MTVNTNETRKTYNGNGVTTAFATPQFLIDADLVVYVGGVLQTITTDYTVTGAGVPAGGTVTFVTAPPAGTSNVVIIRDPALTQLLDLVENDNNPAATREAAFDKLTMISQRLAEYVSRVLRLSDVDVTADLVLPLAADRASKYLAFDASGDVVASAVAIGAAPVTAFAETLLDDTTAGEVLTTLGVSAFAQTTLDDADAGAFKDTLLIGATTTHNFTSNADYALTAAQEQHDRIRLTDSTVVLTTARNVTCSTAQRGHWYDNATAQDLTVKTVAGTGIVVKAGSARLLICDGTNVIDPLTAFIQDTDKATSSDLITGTDDTKFATSAAIRGGLLVSGTAIATTSGTSHDFTGIPSWAKKIILMLDGVSTNGTSNPLIQIGDSGGIENTGYLGAGAVVGAATNYTTGFGFPSATAAEVFHGTITLYNITGNVWVASGTLGLSNAANMLFTAGSKTLSATLDRVRLTTVGGTNTFDAGTFNIIYE